MGLVCWKAHDPDAAKRPLATVWIGSPREVQSASHGRMILATLGFRRASCYTLGLKLLRLMSAVIDIRIRSGRASDLTAVRELLEGAQLPTSDLATAPGLQIWVAECGDELVGVIAIERYGSGGLLRSLAIAPEQRRHGLGRKLVAHIEEQARAVKIQQLVLLTQTAESFFRTLGYALADRQCVPEQLQQSEEFRSLCPATAACMMKSV